MRGSSEFDAGVVHSSSWPIGSVHKLLVESLYPVKISLPLNYMRHVLSSNTTTHPALHNTPIPNNDAIVMSGTMCPVNVMGRPGMVMSQM